MKRGEIWSGVGDGYAGKPRPMLILQSEEKLISESIVVILVTSKGTEKPSELRVKIEPSKANGLEQTSFAMVDKITPIPIQKMDYRIGVLEADIFHVVEKAVLEILGFGETALL
jgi:mRNA interferase MazF